MRVAVNESSISTAAAADADAEADADEDEDAEAERESCKGGALIETAAPPASEELRDAVACAPA